MKEAALPEIFRALASNQRVPLADLSESTVLALKDYDVNLHERSLDPSSYEFLNKGTIESFLYETTKNWLRDLDIRASTASTNSDLMQLAEKTAIDGVALAAEVQTGGRGRRGRQWVSPFAQNVALSLGMSIDRPTAEIGPISLSIGLAVANAIKELGVEGVQLKWPNDVLIQGQKAAGILIELADATRPATLVVGIGINVHAAPGVEVTGEYKATCLASHTPNPSRNGIVANVMNHVIEAVQRYEREGFEGIQRLWQEMDFLRGKDVVLLSGERTIDGIAQGIDSEGSYLIQTPNGIERAIGGDLSLRLAKNQ